MSVGNNSLGLGSGHELVAALLWGMIAVSPLGAEVLEGCSWAGPDLDESLDRALPEVDLVGSLGSEVVDLLRESGVPVSFISSGSEDPEVRFQRSEATPFRELLEAVMAQTPGYRLEVVSGRLVIYPVHQGYDAWVDLGDPRQAKRVSALSSVLGELRTKSPVLSELRLPTLRPFGGIYGDSVSIGGARTVVEHLVSLIAGSPSANFVIQPRKDGSMQFGLVWADVIEDFDVEAPERVEVGAAFRVAPRAVLADGTTVTLIGSGCGVRLGSADESVLEIDQGGGAVAIAQGTTWIQASYAGKTVHVKVEVGAD